MIPKVIHYCWFGRNPLPELAVKCIESWRKHCPDYQIIEWNESNYNVSKHPFIEKAYIQKKWAFVADYARVDILYNYGGVYLDIDVELLSNLDRFLKYDFYAGFETERYINFGLGYGSCAKHSVLKDILDVYDGIEFPDDDLTLTDIACPKIQTQVLQKYGLICNNRNQIVKDCYIFRTEYFCPITFDTGKMHITDRTVSVHHFSASWFSSNEKKIHFIRKKLTNAFGVKIGNKIGDIISMNYRLIIRLKTKGIKQTIGYYIEVLKGGK